MLVRTPRGGLHVYFEGTGQGCGSLTKAGHCIDFKAAGGYMLAPPSTVHGKPYELLDQRDATAASTGRPFASCPTHRTVAIPACGGTAPAATSAAWPNGPRYSPEANRNAGLYWAACRAVENGLDPSALVLAAVTAGLSETEARRTIESARRAHQGTGRPRRATEGY
jgi:hypothetical protein